MTHALLIERITRSLAYMLRHKPEEFELQLDREGFGDLNEVVQALNERLGEPIEEDDVREAIEAGDRPRYEIRDGDIRALYGHSIDVDPGTPSKPPELLYVALGSRDAERAARYGLNGGRRRFLHLALNEDDAMEMGRRLAREYVVVTVHSLDAWEEDIDFYDRRSIYLSGPIPKEFLSLGEMHDDGEDPQERSDRGERSDRPDRGDAGRRRGRFDRGGRPDRGSSGPERGGRGREREGHGRREEPVAEPARPAERAPREWSEADRRDRRNDPPREERRDPRSDSPRSDSPRDEAPRGDRRDARSDAPREERREAPREERRDAPREERREAPREARRDAPREERRDPRNDDRRRGPDDARRGDPGRGPGRDPEHRERPPHDRPAVERIDRQRELAPPPRRDERRAAPASAPPAREAGGPGFGLGIFEAPARREAEPRRSRPEPAPEPPPRREPPAPPRESGPGFGAGL